MKQTSLKIFEKVNLRVPVGQRRFFHFLNEAVNELIARYGAEYVLETEYAGRGFRPIESLNDPLQLRAQFVNPVLYGILSAALPDDKAKAEELRLADEAYTSVWKDSMKGRRIKRNGW